MPRRGGGARRAASHVTRGATARPAALAEAGGGQKRAPRLSPGGKNGRKRRAELGGVYGAPRVARTAADIIGVPAKPGGHECGGRSRGPVARGKWLTASVT